MSDFTQKFYLDPGITIKQEPIIGDNNMITSACVPIPSRPDYRDYTFDTENSQSPIFSTINFTDQMQLTDQFDSNNIWSNKLNVDMFKSETLIHMDEDDIFQVDKADLIQGPTLAELNANDENLLGDLNFDDLLLPEESTYTMLSKNSPNLQVNNVNNNQTIISSSCPQQGMMYYRELELSPSVQTTAYDQFTSKTPISTLSPNSPTSSSSSIPPTASSPMHINGSVQQKNHSTLHDLLMKRDVYGSPDSNQLGHSVPSRNTIVTSPNTKMHRQHTSPLSTSAPTHLGLDQIWQRREPRKHYLSTSSMAEAGSTSSLSTGGILSPDPQDFSHDEFDSEEDSDGHYEDYSSGGEGDSDDEDDHSTKPNKKERYFWQYNVQAKGPKGQRLVMKCKMEDPHVLNEVTDPVFSPDCSVRGIKHSGKARKGDGNDLTPNAKKLYQIGKELDKLGRIINDMTPVSELPFNVRPTSRKEKNKLASRACRLKKKAQHEANKIKLNGLEIEHKRLLNSIIQVKQILATKLTEQSPAAQEELTKTIERLMKSCNKVKVAGHTTEYVNKILDKVRCGGATILLEDM